VLDQHRCRAQLALLGRRCDLVPVRIRHIERIAHAVVAGVHRHARDINPCQRQRVRELVQKADRIERPDAQHGVMRGGIVVYLDLDGIERVGCAGYVV